MFNQPSGPWVCWLVSKHPVDELEDLLSFHGLYNGNTCALHIEGRLNLATLFVVKPVPFTCVDTPKTSPEPNIDVEERTKIHTENEIMLKLIHGTEPNFLAVFPSPSS